MNSLLGACSGSYCLNILYCTICLGLLQDNNLQQNHVKFGTCSCTVATFSWCAPEMLNARVSSKYIPRIVQKLKWFNSDQFSRCSFNLFSNSSGAVSMPSESASTLPPVSNKTDAEMLQGTSMLFSGMTIRRCSVTLRSLRPFFRKGG